jgi:hypothetical protein
MQSANGLLPVSDASTVAGMMPEPGQPVTYVSPTDPTNVVRAVPGSPEAIDAERNGLLPVSDASTVAGMMPQPTEPATLIERQQATITNQNTLDNLESLSPQELGLFAANAAAYIQETVSVAGVSSRLPLPPNTQEAMRRARAAGIVFPGIDPMSYGATPTAEDIEVMGLNILDPSIDLSAATGLLAPVQRTINFIGEQLAECRRRRNRNGFC